MRKTNQTTAILAVCLGIDLMVLVIFYFLINTSGIGTFMYRFSFVCLMAAEAVGTVKAVMAKRTILGFANINTSIIHITVVFAVSVLFAHFFPMQIKAYILLNILGWAIMMVFDVSIYYFNNSAAEKSKKLSHNMDFMDHCYVKVRNIGMEYKDSIYSKELYKISEIIKYSDYTLTVDIENIFMGKLLELEQALRDDDNENVQDKIKEVMYVFKIHSGRAKRGSF